MRLGPLITPSRAQRWQSLRGARGRGPSAGRSYSKDRRSRRSWSWCCSRGLSDCWSAHSLSETCSLWRRAPERVRSCPWRWSRPPAAYTRTERAGSCGWRTSEDSRNSRASHTGPQEHGDTEPERRPSRDEPTASFCARKHTPLDDNKQLLKRTLMHGLYMTHASNQP